MTGVKIRLLTIRKHNAIVQQALCLFIKESIDLTWIIESIVILLLLWKKN